MQSTVYISDTSLTLKQSQGYPTQNDNVDPKQGYNYAKFKRSCFNGVQEKVDLIFGNMSIISLEHVQKIKKWYIHDLLG